MISMIGLVEGLHERFATIDVTVEGRQLTFVDGRNMQIGEPRSVQAFPFLYTLMDRGEDASAGNVMADRDWLIHRVVFKFLPGNTSDTTELQLLTIRDALPAAVYADRRLNNRLVRGYATIDRVEAGYDIIGDTLHRVLDFYSNTLRK